MPGAEPPDTGERLVPGAHPGHITEAEHLARYQLAAALAGGKRVLDAACGLGYGSAMMARARATAVEGIDVDPETVEWATERFGDSARFRVGDVLALPHEADSFDLVVSFETIEHVADPFRALDELRRVLRPDGILIASSPNPEAYRGDNPFHLRELTPDELEEALRSRFTNVRILRQGMAMASVITAAEGAPEAGIETELGGSVRRVFENEGGAQFTIGVAGDGELPEIPPVTTLTGEIAMREWFDAAAAWEERARRAEANAEASGLEAAHALKMQRHAVEELREHKLRQRSRRRLR